MYLGLNKRPATPGPCTSVGLKTSASCFKPMYLFASILIQIQPEHLRKPGQQSLMFTSNSAHTGTILMRVRQPLSNVRSNFSNSASTKLPTKSSAYSHLLIIFFSLFSMVLVLGKTQNAIYRLTRRIRFPPHWPSIGVHPDKMLEKIHPSPYTCEDLSSQCTFIAREGLYIGIGKWSQVYRGSVKSSSFYENAFKEADFKR